jgi:CxxC motif-containing protein
MIAENQRLIRVRDSEDELTCIVCPIGCRLHAVRLDDGTLEVTGNQCRRGIAYAEEEFRDPRRVVTGTCALRDGVWYRLPVRSSTSVPVQEIAGFLNAMYALELIAPVNRGDTVATDVAGTGIDLVATMTVPKEGA